MMVPSDQRTASNNRERHGAGVSSCTCREVSFRTFALISTNAFCVCNDRPIIPVYIFMLLALQVCNTIRHPLHPINYTLSSVCDGFNYTHIQSLHTRARVVSYLTSPKHDSSMANISFPLTKNMVQAGKINLLFCMRQGFIIG